jgi:hypothetical protein
MPCAPGQPLPQVTRPFGIVENQQPPLQLSQLPHHHRPYRVERYAGLDATQLGPQGSELLPDQLGLLSIDPPSQVISPGEPVRVLDRQLGLPDTTHPMQGLHHRPIAAEQPLPHRHQQPVPPGEPRIARRDIPPYPRHATRKAHARPTKTLQGAREPRRMIGPSGPLHRLQQNSPCLPFIDTEDVPEHQRTQHSRHLSGRHFLHPYGDQTAAAATGHMQHRSRPFLGRIPGPVEIRGREQRQHPVAPVQRITHRRDEVPAGGPVPHIQLNRVSRLS